MEANLFKPAWWFLKYRICYPRFKKRSMYFSEPNLVYGLTDHPLDKNGWPVLNIFTVIRQLLARKPVSILKVRLKHREKNSFTFEARGYNILNRDLDILYIDYKTGEKVKYTDCTLRFDILSPKTYRLRLAMGDEVPPHDTPMVNGEITGGDFEAGFKEDNDRYLITTDSLILHVFKEDFRIKVYDSSGALVTESGGRTHNEFPTATDAFPLGFVKSRRPGVPYAVENFNLHPGESIFGLGERFGPLNRVGQTISLWTLDATGNSTNRSYKPIPFFMSSRGYGVFVNDYNPMTFWVGTREVSKIQVAVENSPDRLIDYYFFYGPEPKEVLGAYTSLTGRAKVPPRWSFGSWMSRCSYGSEEEVMEVAKRLRDEKYPSDVINIDTNWSTVDWACEWEFDKGRFPDPERMFRECLKMGFKICLWQIPYIMDGLPILKDARKKGVLAKNHGPFLFSFFGTGHVIDFSKEEGIKWYKERLKGLFEMGNRVIKVDFGEQVEPHQEFHHYSGREMHNLYPLLYNRAAFEITEDYYGKGEALIWARSAYAGSQRYPVHWSGDNSSNYPNMLASLRGGLSLGLCGFTFWSQDTGGFVGIPDDDLYVRWTAFSLFNSHIRFHSFPPKFREPWNFSPEAQDMVRGLLELRYRLIPYIYSESIKAAKAGLPLIRPLFLEFPEDPTCYSIEDQFLTGEKLLVAPILTEMDRRRIYLPEGLWHDFWTGKTYTGPLWIEEECPIGRIPVYVRGGKGGTALPLGEVTQSVPDGVPDRLTLIPFPDIDGKAAYTLYDEEGSIEFAGRIDGDRFRVEVLYEPESRKRVEVDISTISGEKVKNVEVV